MMLKWSKLKTALFQSACMSVQITTLVPDISLQCMNIDVDYKSNYDEILIKTFLKASSFSTRAIHLIHVPE